MHCAFGNGGDGHASGETHDARDRRGFRPGGDRLAGCGVPGWAQHRVAIGDEAILHVPPYPRASAVLVPRKGGIDPADPLLRHREALNARGVGRGARPDMLILISGSLMAPGKMPAQDALKTPTVLPPTLVMANRNDACDLTPVAAVEPFVAWSGGRATVQWIGGGGGGRDPCGPSSAHGFMGADREVVDGIARFVIR